ncbi:MAG: GFA family protein [Devosia sp.]
MFGIGAFFNEKDVSIVGASACFSRPSDSGFDVRFHFCPTCASTVFWRPSRRPDLIAVAAGSFSDPEFPAPNKAVFDRRRPTWIDYAIEDRTD